MPKLSVLLPVYRVENYPPGMLYKSVMSVLALNVDKELIIIDNGNPETPDCLAEVRGLRDVKVYRLETNKGASPAGNLALSKASGQYIWIWGIRNEALPVAVKLVEKLDNNPDIGFAYGSFLNYGSAKEYKHNARAFDRKLFAARFMANSYMYRLIDGIEYVDYLTTDEGETISIADRDMFMQLLERNITGAHIKDTVMKYYNGGRHNMTIVQEHRAEIDRIFNERWRHIL